MNCVIYVVPVVGQSRFDVNGEYSFRLAWETPDGNYNEIDSPFIAFSASDQTMDNAIKDAVVADALAYSNTTIVRNDCRIFR